MISVARELRVACGRIFLLLIVAQRAAFLAKRDAFLAKRVAVEDRPPAPKEANMPRRSRWDQEDSDEERPVYRGPRNYEGATSVIGDAWDDLVTSVKRAAEKIRDANDDGTDGPTLSERAKQSWEKAKVEWEKMNEQQKNTSGMPEGCFCDMRGWACPKHRGKEKWRQSHVVKIHEAYNGGDGGAAANGAASDAAAEDNTHLDALMAQLMTMGFEPERITQALTRHRDLESAISFLIDSPEPPPESLGEMSTIVLNTSVVCLVRKTRSAFEWRPKSSGLSTSGSVSMYLRKTSMSEP